MLQGLLEKFNSVNELGLLDLLSNKERENFIAKISPGACREMNGLKKFLSLFLFVQLKVAQIASRKESIA